MHIPASIDSQHQKPTYFHQTILCQWVLEFMLFCIKRLFLCFSKPCQSRAIEPHTFSMYLNATL